MIRLLINGAKGRMAERIRSLARDDRRFEVLGTIAHDDDPSRLAIDPGEVDLLIDFTIDAGTQRALDMARTWRCALLIGTTALSAQTVAAAEETAREVPLMIAPNTSVGVAVLNHLIAVAAQRLGPDFDVDIIETHHRAKRDAPSGTALRLAETLRGIEGVDLPDDRLHCIRAGDVVGEHTIEFSGAGERIRLAHLATSRDVFAAGALRAGAWLCRQKPGRYTIEQSLGM